MGRPSVSYLVAVGKYWEKQKPLEAINTVILQLIFVCNVVKYDLTLSSAKEVVLINHMIMCS